LSFSNPINLKLIQSTELLSILQRGPHQVRAGQLDAVTLTQPVPAHRLRLFGGQLCGEQLQQLLDLLAVSAFDLSVQTPHADLAPAYQCILPSTLTASQLERVQHWAAQQALELVYQQQAPTLAKPGLLVMDMDSTAIQIECIDEIAKLAGTGDLVAAVTARAMNGELDFAQSLRQRVATLAGADQGILQQVLTGLPLMPGLVELVTTLQQHQWQVVIASGGFTFFTQALQQQLGLTATFANELEIIDGRLTGQVLGSIVDAQRKADVVEQIRAEYHIEPNQTVAIGDGANDLPMLAKAALGVAFHAKPKVQAQAKAAIRQGSLLQLLYLLD